MLVREAGCLRARGTLWGSGRLNGRDMGLVVKNFLGRSDICRFLGFFLQRRVVKRNRVGEACLLVFWSRVRCFVMFLRKFAVYELDWGALDREWQHVVGVNSLWWQIGAQDLCKCSRICSLISQRALDDLWR